MKKKYNLDSIIKNIFDNFHKDDSNIKSFIKKNITFISNKDVLVLGGGGIKGISLLGAINAIDMIYGMNNFKKITGVSVGGLIGALYLIGYNEIELLHFCLNFDFNSIKDFNVMGFILNKGLNNLSIIENILEQLIEYKNLNKNITMSELYNITNINLELITTRVEDSKIINLNHLTHPDLKITTAIKMSICIPIYFEPIIYENMHYVDGGCMNNLPINNNEIDRTIALDLFNYNDNNILKIESLENYFIGIINCLSKGMSINCKKGFEKCTIEINVNYSSLKFDITKSDINNMFEIGYNSIINNINKL